MNNRSIAKDEWKSFFDLLSKSIDNQEVDIEVAGLDIGAQVEAEWLPLDGISYETKSDTLFIYTPDVDHSISHPTSVAVALEEDLIRAIEIKDSARSQIMNFRPPLRLEESPARKSGPKMTETRIP